MSDLFSVLSNATLQASALRIVVSLQPANADGLIYPPTYEGGMHIFRPAWIKGEKRDAVLLDSVQSQANRIEMAILAAYKRKALDYPDIELHIDAETGMEKYSVLELSHRVYDAALRMATINGQAFTQSDIGKGIYEARTERAAELFKHAPITLALGGWDSHGGGGPMAAKLPRLITSEIVGLDAKPVDAGAVKSDPMDIRKEAGPIYLSKDAERRFEIDKDKAVGKKEYKPSEIGLGNVPNFSSRGAVITEAVQTSVVSCAAVRRLRFEKVDGIDEASRNHAGQTATIALGLYGLLAQMDEGYYLRSRCDLIPVNQTKIEVIGRTLDETEEYQISPGEMLEVLKKAREEARRYGLEWRTEPLVTEGDERLTTMIERSRKATKLEE